MLLAPPEDLGQAIDASPHSKVLPTVWKKNFNRFVRDVEQRLVEDAIQQGSMDLACVERGPVWVF